ncbi:MAG: DUF1572 domain-containing protein [Chitinophagaceae bacterium]|nr:MAG: DUF1572 domain-containing protein [Chitinophagaceae bacterium]
MDTESKYLASAKQQFLYYKALGDQAMAQLEPQMLFMQPNEESNSIAMIIQHLHGNMVSRWTNFLTTDGEKEWRQRDAEFEVVLRDKAAVMQKWEEGWDTLMSTLQELDNNQLSTLVLIRNEAHTVTEAINRQLAHYPYHVGQIVLYAKQLLGNKFCSLSIAKNKSQDFNREKFGSR